MIFLIVSVLFSLFAINNGLTDRGAFSWKKFGASVTSRIAGGNGGVTLPSSSSVQLLQQYQPRVYLMESTSKYLRLPDLRGQTIRFTVDLSKTTCNCNAALYLVQMPSNAVPDYYCDAQGSPACAEYDLLEANTRAFQATVHTATGDDKGKWGCAWNIKSAQGYGPGGSSIDTSKPYTVDYAFTKSSAGKLNGIKVKLSQSGKSGISYSITDSICTWLQTSTYISSLDSSVASGQCVLVMSYWSGGMDWLDGCSSGVTCPSSSTVTFSNIQLVSGITAANADELSESDNLPFEQSPLFIGIMCAIGVLLLVGVITFIIIRRKHALNQEIV
jgi:hypothetical protein